MKRVVNGFTIIELLTVMAIMVILATIVVMGYFGATRGLAAKSAGEHLAQSLNLARQCAIMQNKKVAVVFGQDASNSWYSICQGEGRITHNPSANKFGDEFGDWNGWTNTIIYNLDTARTGMVKGVEFATLVGGEELWLGTVLPNTVLTPGCAYALELYPRTLLPRGLQFNNSVATVPGTITFSTIGVPVDQDGNPATIPTIEIYEKIRMDLSPVKIDVTASGFVTMQI